MVTKKNPKNKNTENPQICEKLCSLFMCCGDCMSSRMGECLVI